MHTLFSFLGKIEDLRLYPSLRFVSDTIFMQLDYELFGMSMLYTEFFSQGRLRFYSIEMLLPQVPGRGSPSNQSSHDEHCFYRSSDYCTGKS